MSSEPPFTNLNNYDLIIRSSRKRCYSLLFQSFKGSFLKHSKTTLSRLSSLTSNTPNASATTRGFVFQTVSPSGKNHSNTKVIRLQNNFVSSLKKNCSGKAPTVAGNVNTCYLLLGYFGNSGDFIKKKILYA